MNPIDIVQEHLTAYRQHQSHAVVTIVQSAGSTPRSNGKMLVYADGTTKGTVGGGTMELLAIRSALECIRTGENAYKEYDLNSPASQTGMACGGQMSVLIEVYLCRPLLVMCGGGHVGTAVIKIASFLGYDTLLVDDRPQESVAGAAALAGRFLHVSDFTEEIRAIEMPQDVCMVIATHDHTHDGAALLGCLSKEAVYIGMIGSAKKVAALVEKAKAAGVSVDALRRVYSPIGLDLGGESPEEIALAIMAEILMVKYGRDARSLTEKER